MDAQHGNPIPTENAASEHGASQGGGLHDEMLMRDGHMTRPLQDGIDDGASMLAEGWQVALDGPFSDKQYRILAARTMFYLTQTRASAQGTKQHLLDIMMAQDFQDLTGQVIKRVTELAHNLEQQQIQ